MKEGRDCCCCLDGSLGMVASGVAEDAWSMLTVGAEIVRRCRASLLKDARIT